METDFALRHSGRLFEVRRSGGAATNTTTATTIAITTTTTTRTTSTTTSTTLRCEEGPCLLQVCEVRAQALVDHPGCQQIPGGALAVEAQKNELHFLVAPRRFVQNQARQAQRFCYPQAFNFQGFSLVASVAETRLLRGRSQGPRCLRQTHHASPSARTVILKKGAAIKS